MPYTPTRKVLVCKYDKFTAAENLFISFLDDHTIETINEVDVYKKDGKTFMLLDKQYNLLWIHHDKIWLIFNIQYELNFGEIQAFLKKQIVKHLQLDNITPLPNDL
jgi:hypothetical protein